MFTRTHKKTQDIYKQNKTFAVKRTTRLINYSAFIISVLQKNASYYMLTLRFFDFLSSSSVDISTCDKTYLIMDTLSSLMIYLNGVSLFGGEIDYLPYFYEQNHTICSVSYLYKVDKKRGFVGW